MDAVRSRDDTRLDAAARIQSDFAKNADANRICVSCIDMFVRHVAAPYYLSVSVLSATTSTGQLFGSAIPGYVIIAEI